MALNYLHHHPNFSDLIYIVAETKGISPVLVGKDYWIMHCLYGLQQQGFDFQMKGGTSLSKGYKLIHRFSEDIDILIEPPVDQEVATGHNQDKEQHRDSRRKYYDWLAETIQIDGIIDVQRDTAFDDLPKYRSAGVRLFYDTKHQKLDGVKEGILLEVGFDEVHPNQPLDISSWAYDFAAQKVELRDNRAKGVLCYHPGYTFVEKLQTISTKFRKQQENGQFSENFMRHYYDIYCLLQDPEIQAFIGTPEYLIHKKKRFRAGDNPDIASNEAFVFSDNLVRLQYEKKYNESLTLYYQEKPSFEEILGVIRENIERL